MTHTDNSLNFMNLPPEFCDPATAKYAILPIPFDGTVSYKKGTAAGPIEIIGASAQVEWFDDELMGEFVAAGVATYGVVAPSPGVEDEMHRVRRAAQPIIDSGKFLLSLGGEHSVSGPLIELAAARYGPISVLQIDAHADLRDSYGGTKFSHAAVMRRAIETPGVAGVCQVGIRNFSLEEVESCPQYVKNFITPAVIESDPQWIDRAMALLGERVYITIDVDGFDPSVAPGTGTPEPGGLSWRQGLALLNRVCTQRQVVAADIVEVAPIPDSHVTEFMAARLAYKLIAYTQLERD